MTISDSIAAGSPRQRKSRIRQVIGGIDQHLSRSQGVRPFSSDPRCILRIALVRTTLDAVLSDGCTITPGDTIADIHCWNERVPPVSDAGPDLAWAQVVSRRLRVSLQLLAARMPHDPELALVKACRARVNLVGQGCSNASVSRIIARMGFEDVHEGPVSAFGRLHDGFENLLTAALVWTYNPRILRRDKMMRERRPVWSSRATLLRLHGEAQSAARGIDPMAG